MSIAGSILERWIITGGFGARGTGGMGTDLRSDSGNPGIWSGHPGPVPGPVGCPFPQRSQVGEGESSVSEVMAAFQIRGGAETNLRMRCEGEVGGASASWPGLEAGT